MGKLLGIILAVTMVSSLSFAQEQTLAPTPKSQPTIQVEKVPVTIPNNLIHKFNCRRCGSENHFQWRPTDEKQTLEIIPHCQHCGKKYWPKFKPSGFLDRIYCTNQPEYQPAGKPHS